MPEPILNEVEAREAIFAAVARAAVQFTTTGLDPVALYTAIDAYAAAVRAPLEAENERLREVLLAAEAFIDSPHVVQIREHDWGLQHPPRCRSILTACPVHKFMLAAQEPPASPGDYFIDERARISPHDGSEDAARPFVAAVERARAALGESEVAADA